ncbi:MAG: tetratricopeptide repeat protein [Devosia sp.]
MKKLLYAHSLLWRGDRWYRRAWFAGPQLLAIVGAVWLLVSVGGTVSSPAAPAPDWASPADPPPVPPAAPTAPSPAAAVSLDSLRDRAGADPAALSDLRKAAVAGNAEAQFYLGTLYDPTLPQLAFGTKDIATSFEWYRKSAEQGSPGGEQTLAQSYQIGWGVAQNDSLAAQWFQKAAQHGMPLAQDQLGLVLARGQGVAKDCTTAKTWLAAAAALGNQEAASNLSSGAGGACQW